MTKELSKQICEICGIKPKRDYELTIDNTSEDIKFNKHKVCYGYPDFGEPENFVKLLRTVSKKVDVIFSFRNGNFECAIYAGLFTDESFENNFLNALVRIIKDNPISYGCNYFTQESIKQSIREAEWKYD